LTNSTLYLDVYVNTATAPAPITIRLYNNTLPGFLLGVTAPTFPAVTYSNITALRFQGASYGSSLQTNSPIVGSIYMGNDRAPTVAVQTAAGSGATASVNGTSTSGLITLTAGSGPASGIIAIVTLQAQISVGCAVTPQSGAQLPGLYSAGLGLSNGQFEIGVTSALVQATTYTMNYLCTGTAPIIP
jgi:hypothetical protein